MRFTKRQTEIGWTVYSPDLPGDAGNYGWTVSVDVTAPGYVGITQVDEAGRMKDRVLLSVEQWRQIVRFVSDGAIPAPRRKAAVTSNA